MNPREGKVVQIRQNYAADSEAGVNKQINIQLYTSYVYQSMSYYFDREDVALQNVANFFKQLSDEEKGQADKLMKYQNTRGGRIVLQNVEKPEKDAWGTPLEAFQAALAMEKDNNKTLLDLHQMAAQRGDPQVLGGALMPKNLSKLFSHTQMTDFIEEEFLRKKVELLEKLGKAITNLKRVGPGLGEYLFDKEYFS